MSYIPQRACYFIAVEPLTPLNDEESETLSDQIDEMLEPFIEASHACVYRAKAHQK
ncbi:hypothetical protein SAMN06265361_1203 [Laceyella tengchongensis]|uniref:Uncharacterized protein n=1 Tax=Laceyella tengchongensis TaxID=574699 RepID=A0AA46AH68_9BACL|nr:hypothetical protein SAMN06265361_1203 [Laceyella tengchongensis]